MSKNKKKLNEWGYSKSHNMKPDAQAKLTTKRAYALIALASNGAIHITRDTKVLIAQKRTSMSVKGKKFPVGQPGQFACIGGEQAAVTKRGKIPVEWDNAKKKYCGENINSDKTNVGLMEVDAEDVELLDTYHSVLKEINEELGMKNVERNVEGVVQLVKNKQYDGYLVMVNQKTFKDMLGRSEILLQEKHTSVKIKEKDAELGDVVRAELKNVDKCLGVPVILKIEKVSWGEKRIRPTALHSGWFGEMARVAKCLGCCSESQQGQLLQTHQSLPNISVCSKAFQNDAKEVEVEKLRSYGLTTEEIPALQYNKLSADALNIVVTPTTKPKQRLTNEKATEKGLTKEEAAKVYNDAIECLAGSLGSAQPLARILSEAELARVRKSMENYRAQKHKISGFSPRMQ